MPISWVPGGRRAEADPWGSKNGCRSSPSSECAGSRALPRHTALPGLTHFLPRAKNQGKLIQRVRQDRGDAILCPGQGTRMGPDARGNRCAAALQSPGSHSWQQRILYRKERNAQNWSLHCVSYISGDAVIPISEHFILLVELPLVFANGHRKPFLFKIRLLFFSNGCFF